jgi:hypothetical protein
MRVLCARASPALAAPSRHFQLFNDLSKRERGRGSAPGRLWPGRFPLRPFGLSVIIAQPSPAPVNTYFSTASITRGCNVARASS